MERQVGRSTETVEDALKRLADSSRRVEMLEGEAQVLKSQLSKMINVRDSAVVKSST